MPPVCVCVCLCVCSLSHIPDSRDSERPKHYAPRTPYRTHPSFPQMPASHLEMPAMFEKFDVDLLFFIFYYQQVRVCRLRRPCTPLNHSACDIDCWLRCVRFM